MNFSFRYRSSFNKPNHQGYHKRPPFSLNTKLLVRQIPSELNNISKLNEHFSKFGTIVNLQVSPRVLPHIFQCLISEIFNFTFRVAVQKKCYSRITISTFVDCSNVFCRWHTKMTQRGHLYNLPFQRRLNGLCKAPKLFSITASLRYTGSAATGTTDRRRLGCSSQIHSQLR